MLTRIELEHTNPSMGPHEKRVKIILDVNEQTNDRIQEFLETSEVNQTVKLVDFIKACKEDNKELLAKVRDHAPDDRNLSSGETISNLYFYLEGDAKNIELSDVYRRYLLTHFYPDFTRYMVEKGIRIESSNDFHKYGPKEL